MTFFAPCPRWRETLRIKHLAQEHNPGARRSLGTISLAMQSNVLPLRFAQFHSSIAFMSLSHLTLHDCVFTIVLHKKKPAQLTLSFSKLCLLTIPFPADGDLWCWTLVVLPNATVTPSLLWTGDLTGELCVGWLACDMVGEFSTGLRGWESLSCCLAFSAAWACFCLWSWRKISLLCLLMLVFFWMMLCKK